MKHPIPTLLLAGFTALAAHSSEPAKDYFFQPKDRILFLGDSITEQYEYSTYIELYLTSRFPAANFFFLNAGISGDTARGGAARFKEQVLDEKPTKVTINFGMNDGGYGKFNAKANQLFIAETSSMLKMARDAGVRVALFSPNAIDPRVHPNVTEYLETQREFYSPLATCAREFGVPYVDQYGITRAAQERMTRLDPKAQQFKPYIDGVHTLPAGAMLMAHTILTGLKSPALVSQADIDAATGQAQGTECVLGELKASNRSVSFRRQDQALPWPMQKDWVSMLAFTNQLKDLNWYGLKVAGLQEGRYAVRIDGEEVARFSATELATGVNLGTLSAGPVWKHGQDLFQAINVKNRLVHKRFFGVHLASLLGEHKTVELQKRLDQIIAAQTRVNKLAQPRAHLFEVVAAP